MHHLSRVILKKKDTLKSILGTFFFFFWRLYQIIFCLEYYGNMTNMQCNDSIVLGPWRHYPDAAVWENTARGSGGSLRICVSSQTSSSSAERQSDDQQQHDQRRCLRDTYDRGGKHCLIHLETIQTWIFSLHFIKRTLNATQTASNKSVCQMHKI